MSEEDSKEKLVIQELRKEQLKKFTNECQLFGDQLSSLFGSKKVNIEIKEWTVASIPDFYYIYVDFDIPNYLSLLSATWDPRKKILDRSVLIISKLIRGQEYGKKINSLTQDWAKGLRAEKLIISAITNLKWKDSLIQKQGFMQDTKEEDSVYKELL